ncbi:MAG: circadian clock protein KaiC [Candidatus Methanoperedens sp.]|nr:circadian clock protein KaiC [Candidatus Methanoperedens sp.]
MTKEKINVKLMQNLPKCQTGIRGLDEITDGGLPKGRPSLVCGSAGCGKTLLAMEFLVRGAVQYNEPGIFMSFEESPEELAQNVASLGFDLNDLAARKKIYLDHVRIERSEIEETGEYDLEGLFIRLNYAIDSIGAKRVVLDTIESLYGGLSNEGILRAELRRLFRWLKEKGVTAIVTGERGEGTLTRHGLEEYVSDCVILLDNRVEGQITTRRLRVVKYRGSVHGTNEYPFLIDEKGISVLPITSIGLQHDVSTERISSGIPRLDTMLAGKGYYRGSSILISGTAGTGKTSAAVSFVDAACKRSERCLYFAFEEAPNQIIRNMRSIGIDLEPWIKKGLLEIYAVRPTIYGLEMHLVKMAKMIDEFKPGVVVIDPITNLIAIGSENEVKSMLARLVDYLKGKQVTALFTNLSHAGVSLEMAEFGISSLMDTWVLLRDIEIGGERNRGLYILKSRGMAHSNQIREFLLTDKGIDLVDVYLGPSGVLTGSARAAVEAQDKISDLMRKEEIELKKRELERQRKAIEVQIAVLRTEFEGKEEEEKMLIKKEKLQEETRIEDRKEMAHIRKADINKDAMSQPKKAGRRNIK